jgi:long-chain acyl-CoA synthetase
MTSPRFENLVEMFERSVRLYGPRPLFGTKRGGQWTWTTYEEVGRLVDAARGGLAACGLKRGDRLCIVSNNRIEWATLAYACYSLGVALVPTYETQSPKEWAFVANDCGASIIVAANQPIYDRCKDLLPQAPTVKHLIGLSLPKDDPNSFESLLDAGRKLQAPSIHPEPTDTSSLIYTPGTTGNPKGVILSHGNIASNISAVHELLPLGSDDCSLSFVPWADSFGHTCELHALVSLGASIAICEDVQQLSEQLTEVKPTVLFGVAGMFDRFFHVVHEEATSRPKFVQILGHYGIPASKKKRRGEQLGLLENVTLKLADRLVFANMRAHFGGRVKYAFSGGAALPRHVAEFFGAVGVVVYQGYGLAETSPIVSANRPGAHRIGSVGKPILGVKVVIDKSVGVDDRQGEIVVYGPNVMVGYHNREDENRAAFMVDGGGDYRSASQEARGFRTGDLGYLDDDGYLYVTGRIKERYKLENGKYVAPVPLEGQLKPSRYIINAIVYGNNRPYNVALVVANVEALKRWSARRGLSFANDEEMLANPRVYEAVFSDVEMQSAACKGFERIKKIALTAEDFTTANGLLTPSLKLNRRVAMQKFGPQIEALYAEAGKDQQKSAAAAAK